jgi:hypothetical protein
MSVFLPDYSIPYGSMWNDEKETNFSSSAARRATDLTLIAAAHSAIERQRFGPQFSVICHHSMGMIQKSLPSSMKKVAIAFYASRKIHSLSNHYRSLASCDGEDFG